MKLTASIVTASIVAALFLPVSLAVAEPPRDEEPGSVEQDPFEELLAHSPFTRTVQVANTLVLTGTAEIDGQLSITTLDTETGFSGVISTTPNEDGWHLVEITDTADLTRAVATISRGAGVVARIQYSEERIKGTTQRLRFASQARSQRMAAASRVRAGALATKGGHGVPRERVQMLQKIDANELPKGYNPGAGSNREESHRLHQTYVDQRLKGMSDRQRGLVGQMWKQKTTVDPGMQNRGASFVRIMEHVAENEKR